MYIYLYYIQSIYMLTIEHNFFYSRLDICTEKSPLFFTLIKVSPSV